MKKLLCFLMILGMLGGFSATAASYFSYIYNTEEQPVSSPLAVEPYCTISGSSAGITDFNSPQDIFITDEGTMYVADTGNNRIVILDSDGTFLREVAGFQNSGESGYIFSASRHFCHR